MTYITSSKLWLVAAVVGIAFLMPVSMTHAQVLSTPSSSISNVDDFIAYLYQLIADLEAVKTAQNQQNTYRYYAQSSYYQPTGQVQGVSFSSGRFDIDTIGVRNTRDDETTMVGDLSLGNNSYADVWFEYGEDDDMDEETRKVRMTRNNFSEFTARVTNLDEDERFYFRAVAEAADGDKEYGETRMFILDDFFSSSRSSSRDDDEPRAITNDAEDIEYDRAELHGEVDMNDFENGLVFFVYGEDEDAVEDVEDEDEYRDIDEDGEDLQKVQVDANLDDDRDYWYRIYNLDDDTDHYFRICVEYDDDDETLECGDVEEFETDD